MNLARRLGSSLAVVAVTCGSAFAFGTAGLCLEAPAGPGPAQEFALTGARPGAWVGLFATSSEGRIDRGSLLEIALADERGVARWSVEIPAALAGSSVVYQAWQVRSSQPSAPIQAGQAASASGLGDTDFFIDCEGTPLAPAFIHTPNGILAPLLMQGYSFAPTPGNCCSDIHLGNQISFWPSNGGTVIAGHEEVLVTRIDGAPFSIRRFDFSGWLTNQEIPFTVTSSSGAVANFVPDGIADGPGGAEDFETFDLPATGFDNVTSVLFVHSGPGSGDILCLDNFVVKPGPAGATSLSGFQTQNWSSSKSSPYDPILNSPD